MNDVAALHEAEKLLAEVERKPRRFVPYESYRGTAIDWLGDIPDHWETKNLKYVVSIKSGENITAESISVDGDFPVYGGNGRRGFTSDFTHDGEFVLVGRQGALCGNVHRVGGQFWASEHCAVGTCKPGVSVDWCAALIEAMNLRRHSETAAQPGLAVERVLRLPVPTPPLDEQEAIARFLDRETAKIDSLVAKKRRLIELLGEKRTALISHAVTKGLNPDAPTKPSGIDWLGDVPAHWEFKKLGFLVSMRGGMTPSKGNDSYWKGTIPWVSPKDMKFREIVDSEDHISESALEDTNLVLFDPPVVLMVVRGMILAHTFPVAITRVPVTVNQDMKALTPKSDCNEEFLLNLLNGLSRIILGTVDDSAHGTKVLRLPVWKHVGVFLPDQTEQADICKHIEDILRRFDGLIKKVESAIDRLNEYRSSLISAAVTGQIDVREEVE